MNRSAFVAVGACALVGFPRIAKATGGLDVAGPETIATIRVLLATGSFAPPEPIDAWHFGWNGRTYRGTFINRTLDDGTNALVNVLPLDAYLAGVINREMPSGWPDAAQRAQAIVSRTYVLGRLRPEKSYDVVADESDQKYGGIAGETLAGKAAVDATSGATLAYMGMPAHAAYSSCCGGRTADAGSVWNTPFAYLPSVADPYCAGTPAFAWQIDLEARDLESALGAGYTSIGALRSADVRVRREARPDSIAFIGTTSTFLTTPKAFRAALGPSIIRSTYVHEITVGRGGSLVSVTGTGRGHGVGLCQWGANAMAAGGARTTEILGFYFPGTTIATA